LPARPRPRAALLRTRGVPLPRSNPDIGDDEWGTPCRDTLRQGPADSRRDARRPRKSLAPGGHPRRLPGRGCALGRGRRLRGAALRASARLLRSRLPAVAHPTLGGGSGRAGARSPAGASCGRARVAHLPSSRYALECPRKPRGRSSAGGRAAGLCGHERHAADSERSTRWIEELLEPVARLRPEVDLLENAHPAPRAAGRPDHLLHVQVLEGHLVEIGALPALSTDRQLALPAPMSPRRVLVADALHAEAEQ